MFILVIYYKLGSRYLEAKSYTCVHFFGCEHRELQDLTKASEMEAN